MLERIEAFKRTLSQIKIRLEAAHFRIWTELKRDSSEALQNIATHRAVFYICMAEARCSLAYSTDYVASFKVETAAVEPGQTKAAESIQSSKHGAKSCGM